MSSEAKVAVLFVCMGNICRSPLAHGYFKHLVNEAGLANSIHIDSAGTHAYHVGNPPDPRSQDTAIRRGIDLSDQRARQVNRGDFDKFDYVLAMDEDNLSILKELCPAQHKGKVKLFMQYAVGRAEREVPDPYYGGPAGFERVFDMVEEAAHGLLADIRKSHF